MPTGVYKRKEYHLKRLSECKMGKPHPHKGHILTVETRKKISEAHKGMKKPWANPPHYFGERSPSWIKDRSKLKIQEPRKITEYRRWRKTIYARDNFTCKINNKDCAGKIEAHHILRWNDYLELRFEVNNGITLCHAHHPRKRAEEKRLIPFFQELVSVSNVEI